jgi:hypothetical protein
VVHASPEDLSIITTCALISFGFQIKKESPRNKTPCNRRALPAFQGAFKLQNFAFKPADGTRGGILLLWNDSEISISNINVGRFTLSADATMRYCMTTFTITVVYGPSTRADKVSFIQHMRSLKPDHDAK